MRKLLLQLDSSRLPSVFDQVVAYDAGADQVMSYGGVTEPDVRDLILGCLFTRGPKDLHNTAVWIGGSNMAAGEQLLAIAVDSMFAPFKVSLMLDSNGSNTTAVAAVAKIEQSVGGGAVKGRKVVILGGTGPVGQRAAGLLAKAGARVTLTSRRPEQGEKSRQFVNARFDVQVESAAVAEAAQLPRVLDGVDILFNAGAAGVQMISKTGWTAIKTLKVAVDLNAVPPLGIEGVEVNDAGVVKNGVTVFGAFGIGNFKTKLHKACIARLFERNDLVLDAETIADVARELMAQKS
ncbi:MAG TPA: NADP-dependent methylenetetrahydromethanopterin/methylenetetrahydrofolate dehydrogenase [Gemmatimonadales bacterium]|nr:NADP-dependent methylenetetrahydromethanopterin/methylenetetrahydrofolate dehydrogenase [Gemmatimonadales bacterium]